MEHTVRIAHEGDMVRIYHTTDTDDPGHVPTPSLQISLPGADTVVVVDET
jgi:hypothetical protein